MSEPFDWPAIGLWSSAVSFQLGRAIRDAWEMWRQQRQPPTGYEKVIRGERVNGWQNVIPRSTLVQCAGFGSVSYSFVSPTWSMNGGNLTDFSQYSQLMWFVQSSNNVADQEIFHLNRFSMLAPNVHAWIMQVTLEKKRWSFCSVHHLTDRLIVIVFQNQDRSLFCLCLFDVVTSSYRMVKIESPMRSAIEYPYLLTVNISDSPKRRLEVHFGVRSWRDTINEALDMDMITASYEISKSGHDEPPIKATSWQSVAIPMGDRRNGLWNVATWFPPVMHVYQDVTDAENIRSIAFREGTWHVASFNDWLESFRATDFGAKWLIVVESFGALSPPNWALSKIPSLGYTPRISGFTIDGALFCVTREDGILERSVTPHSLKRLAAAAFCKAYPNFNFAELKEVIGFDVFDGIFDGIFDGKEPILIHL